MSAKGDLRVVASARGENRMSGDPQIGPGLTADEHVTIGYAAERLGPARLEVGAGARLRSGTVLYDGSRIGDRLETGHNVIVREESQIGNDVAIWSNSVVDYGSVIGNRVKIHSNCYIAQFSIIQDGAFLAPGVIFTNDLYPGSAVSAAAMRGPVIEAGAQIGANSTVLPYVTVGSGAIVGAGSVVTRDIPAHTVAYGCPAVPVRRTDEDPAVIAARLDRLRSREAGTLPAREMP